MTYLRGLRCPQRKHDGGSKKYDDNEKERRLGDYAEYREESKEKQEQPERRAVVVSVVRERERDERKTEKTGAARPAFSREGLAALLPSGPILSGVASLPRAALGDFRAAKPEMAD